MPFNMKAKQDYQTRLSAAVWEHPKGALGAVVL